MSVDYAKVSACYEDVRSDASETTWAAFGYEGKGIVVLDSGNDYNDLLQFCKGSERVFGYVRIESGDEMSKRAKFVFITWIGQDVTTMQRAKVSTDKAFVKKACPEFGVEIMADTLDELDFSKLKETVAKAGGANYGTGVRD